MKKIVLASVMLFCIFLKSQQIFASDRYWVGGTGSWFDSNHWSESSGGSGGASIPQKVDSVIIDSNSFSAIMQAISIPSSIEVKSLVWYNTGKSPLLLAGSSSVTITTYGSFQLLDPSINNKFAGNVTIKGSGTLAVASTLNSNVIIDAGTGTVGLGLSLTTTKNLQLNTGTFATNNYTLDVNVFQDNGDVTRCLKLGSSIVYANKWLTPKTKNLSNSENKAVLAIKTAIEDLSNIDLDRQLFSSLLFNATKTRGGLYCPSDVPGLHDTAMATITQRSCTAELGGSLKIDIVKKVSSGWRYEYNVRRVTPTDSLIRDTVPLSVTSKTYTGLDSGCWVWYVYLLPDASTKYQIPARNCATTDNISFNMAGTAGITATISTLSGVGCDLVVPHTGSLIANPANGVGPYSYIWSNTATTQTISSLAAGSYAVTVTDSRGCFTTVTSSISTNPIIGVSQVVNKNVSCKGGSDGSATVSVASGGVTPYTYTWPASAGSATTATVNTLKAGSYIVTVGDASGCSSTVTVNITEPAAALSLALNGAIVNVTCKGLSTGQVKVKAAGGTTPWTYSWPAGVTVSPLGTTGSSMAAGTYVITVTDKKLCTATLSATVTEPAAGGSGTVTVNNNVKCKGGATGSATVSGTGGTAPYSYKWPASAGGKTSATVSTLSAGSYIVTITDGVTCTGTVTVTITEPAVGLTASNVVNNNASCAGVANGSATVSGSGGTAPYTYSWPATAGSAITASVATLAAGSYIVTVSDANSCTATTTVTITEPAVVVTASNVVNNTAKCKGHPNGSASISASGGISPYFYSWPTTAGSATTATVSTLSAGTYVVTVYDAAGCYSTTNVIIAEPASSLYASNTINNHAKCDGVANGSATVNASGGTAPYLYAWPPSAGGVTNPTASKLKAGSYLVTVQDANQCNAATSIVIKNENYNLSIYPKSVVGTSNGLSNGTVQMATNGGVAPFKYIWSNGIVSSQYEVVNNLKAGNYTVSVVDALGCIADTSFILPNYNKKVDYCIANSQSSCVESDFYVSVVAKETVSNVLGFDISVLFDTAFVIPSGKIEIANALINPSFVNVDYTFTKQGKMNIVLYLNANAGQAKFTGSGNVCKIYFKKKDKFLAGRSVSFGLDVQESYITGIKNKLTESGVHTIVKDSILNGSIKYWLDKSPMGYDKGNPNLHPQTRIVGLQNSSVDLVDLNGQFRYNIKNGTTISIDRDIAPKTDVQQAINANDALYTRKVILKDPNFVPSLYQIIAMDVNCDGVISAGDVTQIMMRATSTFSEFKQSWNYDDNGISNGKLSKDWLFVDSSSVSKGVEYKISKTFPENDGIGYSKARVPRINFNISLPLNASNACKLVEQQTYFGILLGDVDKLGFQSLKPNGLLKSGNDFCIEANITKSQISNKLDSTIIEIPLFTNADNMQSADIQYTYNHHKLTFLNVKGASSDIVFNNKDSILKISTFSTASFNEDEPIVTLKFALINTSINENDIVGDFAFCNGKAISQKTISNTVLNASSNTRNTANVFPNPVNEMLNINAVKLSEIELQTITGVSLFKACASSCYLDTKQFKSGLYILSIKNSDQIENIKIIIEH